MTSKRDQKGDLCHKLICTLTLISPVIVLWLYLIINFMLILSTIRKKSSKEVAVRTSCFISDLLSCNKYNLDKQIATKIGRTNITWLHFQTVNRFLFSYFNSNILYSVHLLCI